MIGIITGDLINSRKIPASQWMQELKKELKEWRILVKIPLVPDFPEPILK